MTITEFQNDASVLKELGQRIARHRIELGMTQAYLADQAGIAKRTVERIEAGHSTQTAMFVRILRILKLLDNIDSLIPPSGPRPMDILKLKGKERKRARAPRGEKRNKSSWKWDDNV